MWRSTLLLTALALASCGRGPLPELGDAQGDVDGDADTDADSTGDVTIDHTPVVVMQDTFDGTSLISNADGSGSGFFAFDGAVIDIPGSLGMINADADYATSLVNSLASFDIMDGATWTFEVTVSDIQITQDSASYTDLTFEVTLASVHAGKAGFLGGRWYNTTGGFFVSMTAERESSADEVTLFGQVAIASNRKPTDCYGGCAGTEQPADFHFATAVAPVLTITVTLDSVGWAVAFNDTPTVDNGALTGTWASLTEAALSTEFSDGVYLQLFAQNNFEARATCRIDEVRVTRTP